MGLEDDSMLTDEVLATAIPQITNSFHNLADIGWYGSAYLFTTCGQYITMAHRKVYRWLINFVGCQILYARFYMYFGVKWIFLAALFFFELGSLICAVAPNSSVFIFGRAVGGLGAAGLFSGAATAVSQVAPVELRPLLVGIIGGTYGFSSIAGPLVSRLCRFLSSKVLLTSLSIGGVLTDRTTWRWCFYINCMFEHSM